MKIIGLTGGIASGKNFIAEIFVKHGAVIFDADAEVHKLLESDKSTIKEIRNSFPESFIEQKINRKILRKIVFSNSEKLEMLEKILHPKVRKKYQSFLAKSKKEGRKMVILNIPLLLEKKGYECDKIIAVISAKSIQRKRFLARTKESYPETFAEEKENLIKQFEKIFLKQTTNKDRKKVADFVIDNTKSKDFAISQVRNLINLLEK
jgi:dephospho-CoA kinase